MTLKVKATMMFSLLLLSGCATKTSGNYCDLTRAIYWQDSTELLDTPIMVTRQIVEHNSVFEKLCLR